MQNMSDSFQIHEIVWAKVLGHPWWPAQIASISSKSLNGNSVSLIKVNFIGDDSYAELKQGRVRKWESKPCQEESRKLKEAIDAAKQLADGQSQVVNAADNLNNHNLKGLVVRLQEIMNKMKQTSRVQNTDLINTLDRMSQDELIAIVKLNYGQQLYQVYDQISNGSFSDIINKVDEFITCLISKIGYNNKQYSNSQKRIKMNVTPSCDDVQEEQLTKDVFGPHHQAFSPMSIHRKCTNTNIEEIEQHI